VVTTIKLSSSTMMKMTINTAMKKKLKVVMLL